MKTKKYAKANIERKRGFYLKTGFIVVLSVVLIAFEWNTAGGGPDPIILSSGNSFEDDFIINTYQNEPQKVLPPEPQHAEVLELIKNDEPLIDEYIPISTEATTQTRIPISFNIPETPEPAEPDFVYIAEIMPTFRKGGLETFIAWIYKNLHYPETAIDQQLQGKVIARFVVGKDGAVEDITILRSNDELFSREVKRVIGLSPAWEPGFQNGKYVRVAFTLPVKFVLQ